jgi:hypothetical protein
MADLIGAVWLPTLVAAVLVFLASWLIHTVLPHHKSDYAKVPDQEGLLATLRAGGIKPGQYHFPYMDSPAAMKDPAFNETRTRGPVGFLTIGRPGPVTMGKELSLHFVYCVVVSFLAGYVAFAALGVGADYLSVFRITGTAAWMAYSVAHASASIWFFQPWSITWKYVFDGLVYALLTAGAFGWLMA